MSKRSGNNHDAGDRNGDGDDVTPAGEWPGANHGRVRGTRVGRPSHWDGAIGEKRRQEVVLCVGDGLNLQDAADIVECTYDCLRRHLLENVEFQAAVKRARSMLKRRCVKGIIDGEDKWQGKAWFLERRERTEYAPPVAAGPVPEEENKTIRVRDIQRRKAEAAAVQQN